MKKFASVLPGIAILAFAAIAAAGVVVDEQQIIDQPSGNKVTRARTVVIEGDKQKSIIDNGKRSVITDLGKGTMTMVDGTRQSYVEFPFSAKRCRHGGDAGRVLANHQFQKNRGPRQDNWLLVRRVFWRRHSRRKFGEHVRMFLRFRSGRC